MNVNTYLASFKTSLSGSVSSTGLSLRPYFSRRLTSLSSFFNLRFSRAKATCGSCRFLAFVGSALQMPQLPDISEQFLAVVFFLLANCNSYPSVSVTLMRANALVFSPLHGCTFALLPTAATTATPPPLVASVGLFIIRLANLVHIKLTIVNCNRVECE